MLIERLAPNGTRNNILKSTNVLALRNSEVQRKVLFIDVHPGCYDYEGYGNTDVTRSWAQHIRSVRKLRPSEQRANSWRLKEPDCLLTLMILYTHEESCP